MSLNRFLPTVLCFLLRPEAAMCIVNPITSGPVRRVSVSTAPPPDPSRCDQRDLQRDIDRVSGGAYRTDQLIARTSLECKKPPLLVQRIPNESVSPVGAPGIDAGIKPTRYFGHQDAGAMTTIVTVHLQNDEARYRLS
jgi:hypothetical protein